MATILQNEANRRNAKNSTGPRTEHGKAVSRFNALKTGIDAHSHVIPGEDPEVLEILTIEHYDRFQPAAPERRFLVDAMVAAEWQLRRLRKAEAQLWDIAMLDWNCREDVMPSGQAFHSGLDTFNRLHRRIDAAERSYYRALKQLLLLQSGPPAAAGAQVRNNLASITGQPAPAGPGLPPAAPFPAEMKPSPDQPRNPGIGFVPAARVSPAGRPGLRACGSWGLRSLSPDVVPPPLRPRQRIG
jgi:hypothetical protein